MMFELSQEAGKLSRRSGCKGTGQVALAVIAAVGLFCFGVFPSGHHLTPVQPG
jgi:hypothetical protein